MEKITVNRIREAFPKIDNSVKYQFIERICNREVNSNILKQFKANKPLIKQCFNPLRSINLEMNALNELLDGYGIEPIKNEKIWINSYWQNCIALYINMGDSYLMTIVYDTREEKFLLTTHADFIENH